MKAIVRETSLDNTSHTYIHTHTHTRAGVALFFVLSLNTSTVQLAGDSVILCTKVAQQSQLTSESVAVRGERERSFSIERVQRCLASICSKDKGNRKREKRREETGAEEAEEEKDETIKR